MEQTGFWHLKVTYTQRSKQPSWEGDDSISRTIPSHSPATKHTGSSAIILIGGNIL